MGQEVSGPEARLQPVPGALSVFHLRTGRILALGTSKLIPTFAPGSPRYPAALSSRVRRATPSGHSGGRDPGPPVRSPFIPFGPWGSPSVSPRPPCPFADLGTVGIGSGSAPAPSEDGTDSELENLGHPLTTHLPTLDPSGVRRRRRRREAVFPAGLRSRSPISPSPRIFRAPNQKRKLLARNFLKRRRASMAGKSSARVL